MGPIFKVGRGKNRTVFRQAGRGPAKRRFGITSLRTATLAPNENGLGQGESPSGMFTVMLHVYGMPPKTLKFGQVRADTYGMHVLTLMDFSGVVLR